MYEILRCRCNIPQIQLRVPLVEILNEVSPNEASGCNALEQAEQELIVGALRDSNWVVGGARGTPARLGLSRTTLAYKMQKLGIRRSDEAQAQTRPISVS
jgi:transcriptional regulator with GAF, ATPase, and Fis domain